MIDVWIKDGLKHFVPTCDVCGAELGDFETHQEALAAIRESNWLTRKARYDSFEDFCEECKPKGLSFRK